MRDEWGVDQGSAAAAAHWAALVDGLRQARAELEAFAPDVVLVWGAGQQALLNGSTGLSAVDEPGLRLH